MPDPRYFALHKQWLSTKPTRDPLKATKDARQARLIWQWLTEMPRFPVDSDFVTQLPAELQPTIVSLDQATTAG